MSGQKITAGASVRVTLEVYALGTWGSECSAAQVHKQAAEEAMHRIRDMLSRVPHVRVVSEPVVTMITSEVER